MKKKIFQYFIGIILSIICLAFVFQTLFYVRVNVLCAQISKGKNIHTKIGNALSMPEVLGWIAVGTEADIGDNPKIPLIVAVESRNKQAVEVLLKNGADPNYCPRYMNPPIFALLGNTFDETSFEIAEMLFQAGADLNKTNSRTFINQIALSLAYEKENEKSESREMILWLLEHGADYDTQNGELIGWIVRGHDVQFAKNIIINYHIDLNKQCGNLRSALFWLTTSKHINQEDYSDNAIEMAEMLLAHGADKTLIDANCKTAYDYAVENGYTELAELLKP